MWAAAPGTPLLIAWRWISSVSIRHELRIGMHNISCAYQMQLDSFLFLFRALCNTASIGTACVPTWLTMQVQVYIPFSNVSQPQYCCLHVLFVFIEHLATSINVATVCSTSVLAHGQGTLCLFYNPDQGSLVLR